MIEVTFTPTPGDFVAVQQGQFRRHIRSRRFVVRMGGWGAAVTGGFVMLFWFVGEPVTVAVATGLLSGVCGIAGLGTLLAVQWLLVPRRARRAFDQQRTSQYETRMTWRTDGLHQTGSWGTTFLPWADFHGWHRTDTVLLVLASDLIAYFVPRRVLTDDQLEQAVAILTAAGVPRR